MKNITLSIPDDLLAKSRQYAKEHNTSVNNIVREILSSLVQGKSTSRKLIEKSEKYCFETEGYKWNREEIYER